MKLNKLGAALMAVSAAAALAACSSDSGSGSSADSTGASSAAGSGASTAVASSDTATAPTLPSAADLNAVLEKATDPAAPIEEKTATVQGGETVPELFDVMAASKSESGATFQVVDPVLPGYTPDSVLATVMFSVPEQPEQTADNVEFVYEDGQWKLAQSWACILITNTVAPEQVPEMCAAQATPAGGAAAPAGDTATEAPAAQ